MEVLTILQSVLVVKFNFLMEEREHGFSTVPTFRTKLQWEHHTESVKNDIDSKLDQLDDITHQFRLAR